MAHSGRDQRAAAPFRTRTAEGRLIAVVLMLTGIGVIGVFTATSAYLIS
jgi:hypothetical protein